MYTETGTWIYMYNQTGEGGEGQFELRSARVASSFFFSLLLELEISPLSDV